MGTKRLNVFAIFAPTLHTLAPTFPLSLLLLCTHTHPRTQMYDSLTGGFSGSAAHNSAGAAAGGGSGGGGGGGGGGPAGGGGGGGGGTSGRASGSAGRSSRSSGGARNQLVTSVTSRDVREKYEIERSQLGHGHYGVVRRCWDKVTREVRWRCMVFVWVGWRVFVL